MKQRKSDSVPMLANAQKLAEIRAQRRAQRETNHRIEDLKVQLIQFTEKHMEQAVRLIKRWLKEV
ncbi:MAG: flagellar M-ring protein FliF [Desulfovibrio sp.]|nr:flagellar M-ring protein FliF [Desulfovibrio sp.]